MDRQVLVADIGATNSRFQLATVRLEHPVSIDLIDDALVLPTNTFHDQYHMIDEIRERINLQSSSNFICAAAGPIDAKEERVELTNVNLKLDAETLRSGIGLNTRIINDFHAAAMSIGSLRETKTLGGNDQRLLELASRKVVLGPGTGLGSAFVNGVVSEAVRYDVIESEAGHADFAPGNHLELELWSWLARDSGHVCWEDILSGPGILRLYTAMNGIWGTSTKLDTPEEVLSSGLNYEDPVCHQTVETFAGILGSMAGNMALNSCAQGGVFLIGEIISAMTGYLADSPLRRRFEERGALSDYVSQIPIVISADKNLGLLGAANFAAQRLSGHSA